MENTCKTDTAAGRAARLHTELHNAEDVTVRAFMLGDGTGCAAVYLQGACDGAAQREALSHLMTFSPGKRDGDGVSAAIERAIPVAGAAAAETEGAAVAAVLAGDTVIYIDGRTHAVSVATAAWQFRAIGEPPTTNVLRGPREGFTEHLRTNVTMLRRRLKSPALRAERLTIGKYSGTEVCVCYLDGVAAPEIVQKITERLSRINIDGVIDSAYLQQFLEEHNTSLFKQVGIAEKPDIIAAKLLEGRVAVMCDGSPMILTLPFLFFEDFQQSEDYYTNPVRAVMLRFLRLFGILAGLVLPGAYVSAQTFHYGLMPQEFLMTMLNSVVGVPFVPLLEMLVVLLLFEIIHEASFRMPKYVGMAMSIVGALVLGDTAVKAGLISSPSIMVTAISAISFYAVPDQVGP
ncbi:MAG: spore germination protein, partial [Clostridiales bacterium]|nr:spore germination protein [Clostridiales bacterium]